MRLDKFSEVQSIPNFTAISSARHIRLVPNDSFDPGRQLESWDYISISHRSDGVIYASVGGTTSIAASTAITPPFVTLNGRPTFGIYKTAPLNLYCQATGISIMATGATAVAVSIFVGRY
jgi:hypothetical protein